MPVDARSEDPLLARAYRFAHVRRRTDRADIYTDGSFNDQTRTGGWTAVIARTSSGKATAKIAEQAMGHSPVGLFKFAHLVGGFCLTAAGAPEKANHWAHTACAPFP